VQDTDIGAMEH